MSPTDENAPKSGKSNFDSKQALNKKFNVFGHDQQAGDEAGVDSAGSHQHGAGGGEGKAHFHDLNVTKDKDHAPKPGATQPGGHELAHVVQQDTDRLPDPWEDNHQIDLNVDGQDGSGEEIFPDKYGRVKVQFHWDREGKKDSGEGGVNDMTHKRPAPIILAIIAILLLLLGVGLITIFGGDQTAGGTDDATATTFSVNQPATDEPTETTTQDTTTGGGGDQPTAVVNEPPPPVATDPPAECAAGWLPASGCTCCGTTLTCADGTVAEFNPQCGVGGSGGGGCTCDCPVGNPNCFDSCTGAICTP